jgi:PmbA protein
MTQHDPLALLDTLIAKAKAAGADAADALYAEGVAVNHKQRLGAIEELERAEGQDLGLRVFIGQRAASVSSTELAPDTIDELVERAVAMAKVVPEDPFTGIAPSELIATAPPTLDMADDDEPSAEVLIARAAACEDAARAVKGVTNSEGADASWSSSQVWLAMSNGFSGTYRRTRSDVSAVVIAGTGDGMESDYAYSSAVFGSDLEDPVTVGRRAGERVVARLGARRVKSGRFPVIFDPELSRRLVGAFLGSINGAAVARGTSFLKDQMGETVFGPGITIIEDPHRPRGLASKPFDGEGLPNKRRALIDNGVLTTWLLDLRSAKQLGLEPTGHAARGTSGPPSPSSTNVWMEAGTDSPEALIGAVDAGLCVTELMGHGVNDVTGDYSHGASGFWIEKGARAYPVSEVTIAGNLKDMFKAITPANDLKLRYSVEAPTLRVDGLTIAGD